MSTVNHNGPSQHDPSEWWASPEAHGIDTVSHIDKNAEHQEVEQVSAVTDHVKPVRPVGADYTYSHNQASAIGLAALERKDRRTPTWAKVTAAVGSLCAAVGITYAATRQDDDRSNPEVRQSQNAGPIIPNIPVSKEDPSVENVTFPNTLTQSSVKPGNISLAKPEKPGLGIRINWQNQAWSVPKLIAPENESLGHTYTIQDLGSQVLKNYAALMSLDPTSKAFKTVLDNFTDNSRVATRIIANNRAFKASRPSDGAYSNQNVLFDTLSNPVVFNGSFTENENGQYPVDTNNDIYSRAIAKDSSSVQEDPRAYDPAKAQILKNFRFGWHVSGDGATVRVGSIGLDVVSG